MTDRTIEAESEYRLPAAYSQGFAHVRVIVASPEAMGCDALALADAPGTSLASEGRDGAATMPAN
jgi:hypothetical protein